MVKYYFNYPYLEIHEIQEFVDFWGQNLDSFFINFNSVRLFVGLGLWNGSGAASPGVQHDSMFLTFLEHVILKGELRISW